MKSKKSAERFYSWELILYQESAGDIDTVLEDSRHDVLLSPLHDEDYEKDGKKKKPHYHCLVFYPIQKTERQVFDEFESVGLVQNTAQVNPVRDTKGAIDYLCHLNAKNKHLYDEADIKSFGSMTYQQYRDKYCKVFLSADEKKEVRAEILLYVRSNAIYYYSDLVLYTTLYRREWYDEVCDHSIFWCSFLKSFQIKENRHVPTFLDKYEENLILEENQYND